MPLFEIQSDCILAPGSADYYVARFAAPAERIAVAAWLAWFAQLDRIALNAKDPGVARLKLDWWHTEIDQLEQARHPLAQALVPWVQSSWQIEQMHRVLCAIEQGIRKLSPMNLAELTDQCDQAGASRAMLIANQADSGVQADVAVLGRYQALVTRLQYLRRDLQADYVSLPVALLRDPEVVQAGLAKVATSPDWVSALEALLAPFETPVLDMMPRLRRDPSVHNPLRQTAQAVHLVRLMRQHGFVCPQTEWCLSPMRYLWHAWRMK